jgi:hypothetical protein
MDRGKRPFFITEKAFIARYELNLEINNLVDKGEPKFLGAVLILVPCIVKHMGIDQQMH